MQDSKIFTRKKGNDRVGARTVSDHEWTGLSVFLNTIDVFVFFDFLVNGFFLLDLRKRKKDTLS